MKCVTEGLGDESLDKTNLNYIQRFQFFGTFCACCKKQSVDVVRGRNNRCFVLRLCRIQILFFEHSSVLLNVKRGGTHSNQ
jgi:hypothetical protein